MGPRLLRRGNFTGKDALYAAARQFLCKKGPLAHQACDDIEAASCRGTDNQTHRSRRIIERRRDARDTRERGSARYQVQKISAAE